MKIPISEIQEFLSEIHSPNFEYYDESFEFGYKGILVMIWNDQGLFHPFLSTQYICGFYCASYLGKEFGFSIHDGTAKLSTLSSTLNFIKKENQRIKKTLESKAFRESYEETYRVSPLPK